MHTNKLMNLSFLTMFKGEKLKKNYSKNKAQDLAPKDYFKQDKNINNILWIYSICKFGIKSNDVNDFCRQSISQKAFNLHRARN